MSIGPTIETERLILRPPEAQDFDAFCAFMADDASKFVGGPQSPPQVWRGLCTLAGSWAINGYSMWSVIEKSSGDWIGRLGPWQPDGWPGPEVGWGLKRDAWGKGYAFEGATAAIDFAFDELGWDRVIHCIDPDNAPSIILAIRLGSPRLGPTRMPPPFDHMPVDLYGQSKQDWKARR